VSAYWLNNLTNVAHDDGKRFVAQADEKLNKQIVVLFCERKILRCIFAGCLSSSGHAPTSVSLQSQLAFALPIG
jgi:hypothetical protein